MRLGERKTRSAGCTALFGLALAFMLVACGGPAKKPEKGGEGAAAPQSAQAIVEAAADPCTGANSSLGQALCGDPDLQPLVGQIKTGLVEAAAAISPEGAQQMAQGQTQWIESTRLSCGIPDTKVPLSAEQEQCVKDALTLRARNAAKVVTQAGGYTFQTVEINRAQALTAEVAADLGPDSGVFAVTKEIRFPRIEGDSPQIRRFNELMTQRPERSVEDQTSEAVDYKIAYAGPELVSVRFTTMEYAPGAAHPSNGEKVVTVVMKTGEPLKESDVFAAPQERWQAELVRIARRSLMKQIRARGGSPQLPEAELVDTASKTKNWVITEDALIVVFPPESIGPHALGAFDVAIPWKDLAPLLNPQAPAPIRRTA